MRYCLLAAFLIVIFSGSFASEKLPEDKRLKIVECQGVSGIFAVHLADKSVISCRRTEETRKDFLASQGKNFNFKYERK